MSQKQNNNNDRRVATVGVLVTPALKALLRRMADEDERTVSTVTYRLLMESPTLKRKLKEAQAA